MVNRRDRELIEAPVRLERGQRRKGGRSRRDGLFSIHSVESVGILMEQVSWECVGRERWVQPGSVVILENGHEPGRHCAWLRSLVLLRNERV